MNILSIDSSGSSLSIALKKGDEIMLFSDSEARKASRIILSNIDKIMSDNSLKVSDLDAFIFNKGPASFTGTRISASVGQAIGYSQDIPVIGIPSLSVMAYVYFKQSDFSKITCIKKAYGDKIYIGSFDIDKKKYSALKDITLCTAKNIVLDTEIHYVCDCWSEILKTFDAKDCDKLIKHEYNYESNADLLLEYAKDNISFGNAFDLKETFPDYANHTI